MIHVGLKPLTRLGLNTSALIIIRDRRNNQFEDSLLGIVESSLCDGPIYFKCFPNFTVSLTDPNILHSFILNIKAEGFDVKKGTPNVALVYRLCYKVMNTVVPNIRKNPELIQKRKGETTLFITDLEKSNMLVLRTISWEQVKLREVWKLEQVTPSVKGQPRQVESIVQYLNGDVEIKFSQTRNVCLNIGEMSRPNLKWKKRQKVEILKVNKTPEQVSQLEYSIEIPESSYRQPKRTNSPTPSDMGYNGLIITKELVLLKKIQRMFDNPANEQKKKWFLSYHRLKRQKFYLKNYKAYCEAIGKIVDFFEWIEEAYYEQQTDFPNFKNAIFFTVVESTYKMYITSKGKPIHTVQPPRASLIIKCRDKEANAAPYKMNTTNDSINQVIQQNIYTNMFEWNIDRMSEYQIKTIIKYMLMYASAAKLKGNTNEVISKAIITGFTGQLQGCKDPVTNENKADAVNTLIYTIVSHFIRTDELQSDRTLEQLINLRCPTISYFYWYRYTFFSKKNKRKKKKTLTCRRCGQIGHYANRYEVKKKIESLDIDEGFKKSFCKILFNEEEEDIFVNICSYEESDNNSHSDKKCGEFCECDKCLEKGFGLSINVLTKEESFILNLIDQIKTKAKASEEINFLSSEKIHKEFKWVNTVITQKWFTEVILVVNKEFSLKVEAMIYSGADLKCILEGLIPPRYYTKATQVVTIAKDSLYQLNINCLMQQYATMVYVCQCHL
ncbi:hypothetical protein CDL12_09714 [Handroanthus impetiginosus]|uniref:Uncharacterized protein n=1 Tax=Handroanthus impetiginosus TaxID=429701 RepID=A0A2G9HJE5_9LAMI|nr:hypothetical protein CDL12_09714 [Handroanthus impetiginosus]